MTETENPVRVLIADDDDLVVMAERALLEADGRVRVVAVAANGREAIALAEQHRPDVVLMDLEMPVLDGVAATREIRRRCDSAVIIAISGSDYQERALEIREAGASDYLRKSRLADDLLEAVLQMAAARQRDG